MTRVLQTDRATAPRCTVLFVCEYNSCRSQLAEGLARALLSPPWRVLSAGLTRTVVSREVVEVLEEIGLGVDGLRSKSIEDVAGEPVDHVVVLAAEAAGPARTAFPGARLHLWPMEDPVRAPTSWHETMARVRGARDALRDKLQQWLASNEVGGGR